jgi:hypothetical protein
VHCMQECDRCFNACISEPDAAEMAECIQLDRECAQLCWITIAFVSQGSNLMNDLCRRCANACEACAAECEKHEKEHCRRCAEACQQCMKECRLMTSTAIA